MVEVYWSTDIFQPDRRSRENDGVGRSEGGRNEDGICPPNELDDAYTGDWNTIKLLVLRFASFYRLRGHILSRTALKTPPLPPISSEVFARDA